MTGKETDPDATDATRAIFISGRTKNYLLRVDGVRLDGLVDGALFFTSRAHNPIYSYGWLSSNAIFLHSLADPSFILQVGRRYRFRYTAGKTNHTTYYHIL